MPQRPLVTIERKVGDLCHVDDSAVQSMYFKLKSLPEIWEILYVKQNSFEAVNYM